MSTFNIESFTLGPFETNAYLVWPDGSRDAWIIDPGFGPAPLLEEIKKRELTPTAIVLTHAHLDHVAGVADVRKVWPKIPILIHEAEKDWPSDPERNLSAFSGMPVSAPGPDRLLKDGDVLRLGELDWRVLHTPGHSPGSITLHQPQLDVAIVGDALFAGSIGRTDFPGSDFDTLARSIRERLYTLPGSTRVLPGHGEPTTIARERAGNPFVRG